LSREVKNPPKRLPDCARFAPRETADAVDATRPDVPTTVRSAPDGDGAVHQDSTEFVPRDDTMEEDVERSSRNLSEEDVMSRKLPRE
jgi:hypothetical protein